MNGHYQQRRTFRGRGGPNDGRLPKHGFHQKRQAKKSTRSYGDDDVLDDDDDDVVVDETTLPVVVEPSVVLTGNEQDEEELEEAPLSLSLENDECNIECEHDHDDTNNNSASMSTSGEAVNTATTVVEAAATANDSTIASPSLVVRNKKKQEMDHLARRIRQNREAWSLSAVALASPEAYRINVLQATLNCVQEYKSILKFYQNSAVKSNEQTTVQEDDNTDADDKAMSLAIFELIQHALQCGPLAGGKPGYFKRCGSQVATMVHAWLVELCASQDEAIAQLRMTEKQAMAMEKFKAHAIRAAENTKPPSKTVLKKQDAAKKNKAKKNEKRVAR